MALSITATLVGDPTDPPRPIQVAASGLTLGTVARITGRVPTTGDEWLVRGSGVAATSTQMVLVDDRAPLNVDVVYEVAQGDAAAQSAAVQTAYPRRWLLQSLDGQTRIDFWWMNNRDPREQGIRQRQFAIGGRRRPVIRYDVALDDSGRMEIHTVGAMTRALYDLIAAGGFAVLRTDGSVFDLPATEVLVFTAAPRDLLNGYRDGENARRWNLTYQVIDLPEATTASTLSTFADFNEVMAGMTFAQFDTQWAGRTFADFNRFDWHGEAS